MERFRESLPGAHLDLVSGLPNPSSTSVLPQHSTGLVRIVTGCITALFTMRPQACCMQIRHCAV